jgi:hypothetical protein
MVAQDMPSVRLVVAGANHPNTPGYVESVARHYPNDPRIEFTGYVAEEKLPDLFRSATVTVMPYSSSAGSSGVAHLAAQYGVPIVASDITDFRQLADEEGLALEFFKTGDIASMAESLQRILQSPERQQEMAVQNFSVALHMTMPRVIRDYLRSFDLAGRVEALRAISRVRRLPRWMPLRPTVAKLLLRNWTAWRSWLPSAHILQHDPYDSTNGNGHTSGALEGAGTAIDSYGVGHGLLRAAHGGLGEPLQASAARTQEQQTEGQDDPHNGDHEFLPVLAQYHDTGEADTQKADGVEQLPAAHVLRLADPGHGTGNGKHGRNGSGSGHNGSGRKSATHPHRKSGTGEGDSDIKGYGLGADGDAGAA